VPLNIKHPEADQLVRQSGQTATDAVIPALSEQLQRETGRRSLPTLREELLAISDRCAALPDYDTRTAHEIIGFDEHGVPA
jgi:antitoxin VapB